ncbi:unnamed protein product, partial [Rotaria magnacalcarata]
MLNRTLFNARDTICNFYIEELIGENLIEKYYCRTCGHLKGDHRHILSDVENLNLQLQKNYKIEEAALSITSKDGRLKILIYPSVNNNVEHQESEESYDDNSATLEPASTFPSLSKQEASFVLDKVWTTLKQEQLSIRKAELEKSCLTINGRTIRWNECIYSRTRPPTGHSLWISMHGGGGC